MSQWGLPKDVTVIGIWWLGHFLPSLPPPTPLPPSSPSPLPPKSIWPGQPTKLAKTCSLKQGPRDLARHPSPFPRSMKRNLSLEKFTPDSTSNCLSSHTYSPSGQIEKIVAAGFAFVFKQVRERESVQTVLILRCSNCWLGKVSETVEFTQEQVGGQTLKTNNSSCKSSNTTPHHHRIGDHFFKPQLWRICHLSTLTAARLITEASAVSIFTYLIINVNIDIIIIIIAVVNIIINHRRHRQYRYHHHRRRRQFIAMKEIDMIRVFLAFSLSLDIN